MSWDHLVGGAIGIIFSLPLLTRYFFKFRKLGKELGEALQITTTLVKTGVNALEDDNLSAQERKDIAEKMTRVIDEWQDVLKAAYELVQK